jgi:hypothetical protein
MVKLQVPVGYNDMLRICDDKGSIYQNMTNDRYTSNEPDTTNAYVFIYRV